MITDSITGSIHIAASIAALISGTGVLIMAKGSRAHIRMGYFYTFCMIVVLITAFMIYRLFGGWGMFHWAAVISTATIAAGMLPILLKKPAGSYISLHFSFMYWSVIGLYAAFFAELFVRLPMVVVIDGVPNYFFYMMVGVSAMLTTGIGGYFFYRFFPAWESKFSTKPINK